MTTIRFDASTRGHADFGWLNSYHTFSFGEYYDPNRMGFGALRVCNDDTVLGGAGFGTHPHRDMEIISIPLEGVIMHKDSMGHAEALRPGEVQVMSAGKGITHSEYNGSESDALKFLQIWIYPDTRGVTPRYQQTSIADLPRNQGHVIIGPKDDGQPLWIHQRAWLSVAHFDAGNQVFYQTKQLGNGMFVFCLSGTVDIATERLQERDAIGITDASSIVVQAVSDCYVVIIDVPMQ